MLHLFFTITFVAEIIVAYWIISKINDFRKKVNDVNTQVVESRTKIQEGLVAAKLAVNRLLTALNKLVTCIAEKKDECKALFSKNIISVIGSVILKLPYKQILSMLEVIFTIKKMLKV